MGSRSRSIRWRTTTGATPTSRGSWLNEIETAEVFLYPGDRHLFADSSRGDYDEEAAALLKERVLAFLDRVA
jgi:dienelactone hydrolase